MAKVTVKLEGFEALQRALAIAPVQVRAYGVSAINTASFAIAQRARSLVPVASGALQNAIDVQRSVTRLTGGVGLTTNDVYYWRHVEFGTINMSARPFFRPAAEGERDNYIQLWRSIGPKLERDLSVNRFA